MSLTQLSTLFVFGGSMTTSSVPSVVTVDFQGAQLITIKKDENEFVAMKPIVEGIGLDWKTQYRKIVLDKRYGHMTIPLITPGGNQELSCIPLTKLNGWLFSINPNKIPNPQTREKVIRYQEECFLALYNYWHKGIAERKPEFPDTLTPSEQHALTSAVKSKAAGNGKVIPEIWGRVKNKFRVAKYDQITRDRFQEALDYINGIETRPLPPKAPEVPVELLLEVERLKTKIQCLEAENQKIGGWIENSDKAFVALCREVYLHARGARS